MSLRVLAIWVAIAAGVVAAGCNGFGHWMRSHTYPRDFAYLTHVDIQTTMQAFARDVHELDQIMRAGGGITAEQHIRVVELLASLERLSLELKPEARSNHPALDRNLPRLRRDLRYAREGVSWNPPNYYYAGAVSGACVYCHSPPI